MALGALLVAAGAQLALPIALRFLIDQGLAVRDAATINTYFIAFLAAAVMFGTFAALRFYMVSWLGERVVADIRNAVYARVIRMDPTFFEVTRTGEVLSRLTADTTLVQSIAGYGISITLRSIISLFGSLVLLVATSLRLTLIILVVMPFIVAPLLVLGRRLRRLSRDSQDRLADASALAAETINAVQTVQAFTLEDVAHAAFPRRGAALVRRRGAANQDPRRAHRARNDARVQRHHASCSGSARTRCSRATLTFGELSQFLLYAGYMGVSAAALSEMWGDVQRAAGAMERLVELERAPATIQAPALPVELPRPHRGRIQFDNVTFRYPSRPGVEGARRLQDHDRARRDGRVRRPVGRGQEHDVPAAAALLRPGVRAAFCSTASTSRTPGRRTCAA